MIIGTTLSTLSCRLSVIDEPLTEARTTAEAVWTIINRQYAGNGFQYVSWGTMRPDVSLSRIDNDSLIKVLVGMLAPLRDPHVTVYTGAGSVNTWIDTTPTIFPDGSAQPLIRQVVDRSAVRDAIVDIPERNGNPLAYVRIRTFFDGGLEAQLDSALFRHSGAGGLIIDVRGNIGGFSHLAVAAAGRLTAERVVAGYSRVRNGVGHEDFGPWRPIYVYPRGVAVAAPVVVLVDRGSASAAEVFTLGARAAGSTVIGDTTAGALTMTGFAELPNAWILRFSVGVMAATKTEWPVGAVITPDVVVRPTREQLATDDLVLRRAVAVVDSIL